MNLVARRHPDMLRRFVVAPFVFTVAVNRRRVRIESNDLEIALSLRRYVLAGLRGHKPVSLWRVVREEESLETSGSSSTVESEFLRTLFLDGTVLTYDKARMEVVGFLASDMSAAQFVESVVSLLTGNGDEAREDGFYQKETVEVS